MKLSHLFLVLLFGAFMTAFAVAQTHNHKHSKMRMASDTSLMKDTIRVIEKDKYTCRMHPDVILDNPGKCPKCGMTLVKMKPSPTNKKSTGTQKDTMTTHPNMMH
jgi:hypothetical protein